MQILYFDKVGTITKDSVCIGRLCDDYRRLYDLPENRSTGYGLITESNDECLLEMWLEVVDDNDGYWLRALAVCQRHAAPRHRKVMTEHCRTGNCLKLNAHLKQWKLQHNTTLIRYTS